jgi:hypothetical protein
MASHDEMPLLGGISTPGVVRAADTVRRPMGANADYVHGLLLHLEHCGFEGAPRFLGVDRKGREILSFIEGFAPPHNGFTLTEDAVRAGAMLVRDVHDLGAVAAVRRLHVRLARRPRQSSNNSEGRSDSPRLHPRPGRRSARSGGWRLGARSALKAASRTSSASTQGERDTRSSSGRTSRPLRPGGPRRTDGVDLQRAEPPEGEVGPNLGQRRASSKRGSSRTVARSSSSRACSRKGGNSSTDRLRCPNVSSAVSPERVAKHA